MMADALPPGSTIGILGGGQLGRMLALAAARLGLKSHIYSDEASRKKTYADTVLLFFKNAIREFEQYFANTVSIRRMLADGFDTFYEIGPGRVLAGLLKRIDRKVPCTNIPAK